MKREWLIAYRKAKGLSQEEVANAVDVSPSAYSGYENGTRKPKPRVAKALSRIFNFNWILFYEEELNKEEE